MKTISNGKNQRRKSKNPNPKCIRTTGETIKVLLQITEENFSVFQALQPRSCTKLEIGDYITDGDGYPNIFTKDLKPKDETWWENSMFSLSQDGNYILETPIKHDAFHFRVIVSNDDLRTAKMFDTSARRGDVIIGEYGFKVITASEFASNYLPI